jgi:hypothetical protein
VSSAEPGSGTPSAGCGPRARRRRGPHRVRTSATSCSCTRTPRVVGAAAGPRLRRRGAPRRRARPRPRRPGHQDLLATDRRAEVRGVGSARLWSPTRHPRPGGRRPSQCTRSRSSPPTVC